MVIDAYHVWWDPELERQVERAAGRIARLPRVGLARAHPGPAAGRGLMGDGVIDLPHIRGMVERAGYDGPIEVEVINPALAALPTRELMTTVVDRFTRS